MNVTIQGSDTVITGEVQPEAATHIAINKKAGNKNFFCYEKDGTFWTLIQKKGKQPFQTNGSYCSLAPSLFEFHKI